jgi:hypothetical protein
MKPWAPAAVTLAIVLAGLAGAAAAEEPKPAPTPAPAVPESQLKLGPYAGFSLPRNEFVVPELPHFEAHVEVHGRDPNVAMFDWWEHFHFEQSIYGRGINIQSPMPGGGYNILPIIDWLKKRGKNKKMTEPEPEPEPPPQP